MLVIVVENAPPKLRGYLSSWALQVATGVYVANLPAQIRDEIWAAVERWARRDTTAVLLWPTPATEQGLSFRVHGNPQRTIRGDRRAARLDMAPERYATDGEQVVCPHARSANDGAPIA